MSPQLSISYIRACFALRVKVNNDRLSFSSLIHCIWMAFIFPIPATGALPMRCAVVFDYQAEVICRQTVLKFFVQVSVEPQVFEMGSAGPEFRESV